MSLAATNDGVILINPDNPSGNFIPYEDIIEILETMRSEKKYLVIDESFLDFIEFSSGMTGHVHVDYIQKPRVHKLKVVTSEGRFEWDCHGNSLDFISKEGFVTNFPNDNFERNDMFIMMLEEFIDCVAENRKTSFDLNEASYELEKLLA